MPDQDFLQLIVTIDAGSQRPAIIEAARPCQDVTRKEEGCHAYTFFADIESDSRLYVVETWTDEAALERHMQTAHFKTFEAALAEQVPGGFERAVTLRKARPI